MKYTIGHMQSKNRQIKLSTFFELLRVQSQLKIHQHKYLVKLLQENDPSHEKI